MHPLDNVIWQALTTRQTEFAESSEEASRFVPEVSPLAGLREPTAEGYESLAELLPSEGTIALFLDTPYQDRRGWNLIAGAPVLQMVCEDGASLAKLSSASEAQLIELNAEHSAAMTELTALTKPGPFNKRTHELGTFLGICRNRKLVAMAGERLKVPGYTEVSAVCTHPEHAGKGYARILMAEVMRRIRDRGETPFLHVRKDNERAIELYQKLGFSRRSLSHLAVLRKDSLN
jgi:ribosomal protein S18 acetylase RimI-like enzyme